MHYQREHCPSNVSLFLYNAAVWNPHRIHYDETYTKDQEGARDRDRGPAGRLVGSMYCQLGWDFGEIKRFSAAIAVRLIWEKPSLWRDNHCLDEGRKTIRVELWVKNSEGEVTTRETEVLLF